MGNYGRYLESRIIAFKSLKHDVVRVQTESNRRSDGQGAACESDSLDIPHRWRIELIGSEGTSIAAFVSGEGVIEGGQGSAKGVGYLDTLQG